MKFPQLVLFYVRNATSEGAAQSKKKSVIYFSSLIFVGSRPWDVCLCLFGGGLAEGQNSSGSLHNKLTLHMQVFYKR